MHWVCEQEGQLEFRLHEAKRKVETIECLVEKKRFCGMRSANLEEYIIEQMGFDQEPNFDCENPYDGPNVEDKKCFKNLTSRSSFGKQLCLVHPKVLRWITVAQAKLTATVVDNGYCDLSRYSTTCPEFTDEVDVSPIEFNFSEKKPSIILQKIVTQNSLNQQEINDPERIISRQELNASPKIDVTNAQKSIKDEQVTQSLAPEIRRQIFDHKDGTTIGQALDYWWAEKTKLKEKEETLYTCRVEVIAKIRSLHELPSVKQAKNLCEWCSRQRRSRIRPFAMFVAEKAFRTCKECKMRFYSRYGCFTVASNQWIELPRIFDEGIDVVSAYRKLIELNSCSNYIKRDMNFNRNMFAGLECRKNLPKYSGQDQSVCTKKIKNSTPPIGPLFICGICRKEKMFTKKRKKMFTKNKRSKN